MKGNKIRNIGVVAHVDAGKTTLTERILYVSGKSHKMGDVHNGNCVMDSMELERKKGITIASAATSFEWRDHQINLIDTPGHIDFNVEVVRSLRVLDGAIFVFDAVSGVEPQTEINWFLADQYNVPRIALINKMDRSGANFERVVSEIETNLNTTSLVIQYPIFEADAFIGVVDLIEMTAYRWLNDDIHEIEKSTVPESLNKIVDRARETMIAVIADFDDHIMELVIEGKEISSDNLVRAIRKLTLDRSIVPICCASAFKNKGVQPIMDAVVKYLPSPVDGGHITGETLNGDSTEVIRDKNTAFTALIFKVVNDRHGALSYLRVYSGELKTGMSVMNPRTEKMERLGRLYIMHSTEKQPVEKISAGDIVAVTGLKDTHSGDTLCDADNVVLLESIRAPEPVIDVAIEAVASVDLPKMAEALHSLIKEDPSLQINTDIESGQTILSGMGELHLEVTVERLRTDFGLEVKVGAPQVSYRERLTKSTEVFHTHKKQRGGKGQYAAVHLMFEPIENDSIVFESSIVGTCIPREYVPAIEQGIRQAANNGVLGGYPCGGFKVTLLDGDTHVQDSSAAAFTIAAVGAFKEAAPKCSPVLLEPYMLVNVVSPPDYVGEVIGDLMQRQGTVKSQDFLDDRVVIKAEVPLAKMFGYVNRLRSLSAGRANFNMKFEHFAETRH